MNLNEMSTDELKKKLAEYEEELDELEDERSMILGQSGQHISSGTISAKYEGLIGAVKKKIEEVQKLLNK